ncbi:MAG: hypothetical protein U1A27_14030 [Phycisphaerae bacterium]
MSGAGRLLATLLLDPVPIAHGARLALLLPLAASVAVVYKSIRVDAVRELPRAAAALWVTIVGGMLGVGVMLYVAFRLLL